MPSPIRVLPEDLVSQIAAGEVVERPASVVKELLENALDAGASRIEVSIVGGGITLIEVSDDGRGMAAGEAPLSLGRHATSKLSSFEQLETIGSYGFRGEALSSIASVSRLRLRTRCQEEEGGVLLEAEGTIEPKRSLAAGPVGTTLSVRDLFYNVPARRKFLRSSNTEAGHVTDVVVDGALSRPDVAFSLSRDGRSTRKFVRVGSRAERVEQVFSGEGLVDCRGERGPLAVQAFLSPADRSLRGALGLRLFVNGRRVRDRALAGAVAHAYGEALERGRYPRGVMYLDLPGRLVDVNVHPQKTEVRFVDPRAVTDAVYSVVRRSLGEPREAARVHRPAAPLARGGAQAAPTLRDAAPAIARRWDVPRVTRAGASEPDISARSALSSPVSRPASKDEPTFRDLRLLGQMKGGYLACEGDDGLYVLDQHAAHECVLFTDLRRAYEQGRVATQALLFPLIVGLSPSEVRVIEQRADTLVRLGLDVRSRERGVVSVHTVPRLLARLSAEEFLRIVCSVWAERPGGSAEANAIILARLACAEALPGSQRIQRETGESLLRSLAHADLSLPALHGKVIVSLTDFRELDRRADRHE